ncbi:MAG: flagellar biosynthetic protein FliR [Oscillospiraceae bacterium]|nr:flagellar biosynthetic protein FliR [Oscillospiraceae bacterium]
MVDWEELTLFLYIAARMSGCVLFNPVLARRGIPPQFQAGLIFILSIFVASMTRQPLVVPTSWFPLAVRILLEMLVGFFLGMIMNFFFYIPQLAGSAIDTQMGMTMAQTYDPGTQANVSVTGNILNTLMLLLFFAENGHNTLLRILLTSGQVVPFGAASFGTDALDAMLAIFLECTLLAIKLCMPILAAELLGQVGMGILMKVIPQINVFAINIELKVIIGLGLLMTLIAPFSEYLLEAEISMLHHMEELLGLIS